MRKDLSRASPRPNTWGTGPGSGHPPLALVTKPYLTTAELAHYINRKTQTLRGWACHEDGPLRPKRIHRILAWPTEEAKSLLGVASQNSETSAGSSSPDQLNQPTSTHKTNSRS
jgi:hypothetical protein